MQGIKALILDRAAVAETPLYSITRWVEQESGHPIEMKLVLRIVEDLMTDDRVRLWEVDAVSGDRTELFVMPSALVDRYAANGHTDPSFDPLGLSVTAAEPSPGSAQPAWDIDVDVEQNTFVLHVSNQLENELMAKLEVIFPLLKFEVMTRREIDRGVELAGSATPRSA
jgi:hypothetical protein